LGGRWQAKTSDRPAVSAGILCWSLPDLKTIDRLLGRGIALVSCAKLRHLDGLEYLAPERGPFVLAANHNTRLEANPVAGLAVSPAAWAPHPLRGRLEFSHDPGLDLLYRRAGAIMMPCPAGPHLLNFMKPRFTERVSPMEQARAHLIGGRSIGVFPEGISNRDPLRLLRGR
jgi:1-acyl-sn-glycerol-3-phosphate acyltransferase